MKEVERRIADVHLLALIRSWLKVPVEERDERGHRRRSGGKDNHRGTPQGGVISPLLANIYMHRYLRAWRERGKGTVFRARLVNYADDFVILSRGHASDALAWTRWGMAHMGLELSATKTRICNARQTCFDFLGYTGYTFGPAHFRKDGRRYLAAQPSRRAVQRLKEKVRAVLRAGIVSPWAEVRDPLNRLLRGWSSYFSYGTRTLAYRAADSYVLTAVQGFLRRRHKVPGRGTQCFPHTLVFGELGVLRLRTVQLVATCDSQRVNPSRRAGCGKSARPVSMSGDGNGAMDAGLRRRLESDGMVTRVLQPPRPSSTLLNPSAATSRLASRHGVHALSPAALFTGQPEF